MRRFVLVVLLLTACSDITFPNERPFEPPDWYADVWSDLAACMEVSPPPLSRVRFYLADDMGDYAGYWRPPHDILFTHPWEDDPRIVGHEMTHDLLGAGWWATHPSHHCEATITCGPGAVPCRYGGVIEH